MRAPFVLEKKTTAFLSVGASVRAERPDVVEKAQTGALTSTSRVPLRYRAQRVLSKLRGSMPKPEIYVSSTAGRLSLESEARNRKRSCAPLM